MWGHFRAAWRSVGEGPLPAEGETLSIRALLAMTLAGGVIVRALYAYRGLPYLHSWDEPFIVSNAMNMLKHGTLDPEFFTYGSLPIYMSMAVGAFHYLWLMGRTEAHPPFLSHIDQITTYHDTGWLWEVSHPTFYLWSRWLAALIGGATVLLAYLVARKLAGRWAGLGAAAFLAFLPFHVEHSSIATVDSPMTFFVLLAAWAAVTYAGRPKTGTLLLSLGACGLAASCKVTAALAVLMPVAALAAATPRLAPGRRWPGWLAAPSVPFLAFLAGTPYALLDMRTFLVDLGRAVRVYEATPWAGARVDPGLDHLLLQAARFASHVGPPALVLILLGAVRLAARRGGWILALYAAAHVLFMGRTQLDYHRNFLVIYPLAAVAFGTGAVIMMRALRGLAAGEPGPQRLAPAAGGILVAVLLGWPALVTAAEGAGHAFVPETRSVAAGLAARAVAEGRGDRVAVPLELRLHPSDLERIGGKVTVAPYLDLLCHAKGYDLYMVPGRWSAYAAKRRPLSELFGRLDPGGVRARASSGGVAPLLIDAPSLNPEVEILTVGPGREAGSPCLADEGAKMLEAGGPWKRNREGELVITEGGLVESGWYLAGAGPHAVVVEARGPRPAGEPARIRLRALGRLAGGDEILATSEEDLPRKTGVRILSFRMPSEGLVAAQVELTSGPDDAARKAGREVDITRIRLFQLSPPGEAGP